MLLCASSPYARRGALWNAYKRHFGKPSSAMVWKADTRTMNPTISQDIIDEAIEADPANAAAEFGAEFRSDVAAYVDRAVVEAAVVPGRFELPPVSGVRYFGFVDPSGGSSDSMTLAIAHREADGRAVLDAIRERRPPFSPEDVTGEFATTAQGLSLLQRHRRSFRRGVAARAHAPSGRSLRTRREAEERHFTVMRCPALNAARSSCSTIRVWFLKSAVLSAARHAAVATLSTIRPAQARTTTSRTRRWRRCCLSGQARRRLISRTISSAWRRP